ncbi:MAG: endonuclease, partial [Bacteroidota bacterium]
LRSGQAFEPREVHEGNVARAMFYMAAVWDDVADLAWFEGQQDDLFEWHRTDAVDQAEVDRSERVAAFQSGCASGACVNPFVVDSTLIRRAFYPEIVVVGTEAPEASGARLALAGPNPFSDATRVEVVARGPVRVAVIDALGREVLRLHDGPLAGGRAVLRLRGDALAPGVYTVRLASPETVLTRRLLRVR